MNDRIVGIKCFYNCPWSRSQKGNACIWQGDDQFEFPNDTCKNALSPQFGRIHAASRVRLGKSYKVEMITASGNFVFTSHNALEVRPE